MPNRNKLSKQPARIILIHLNGVEDRPPFQKLVVVLENFFLLLCRMTGTIRVPYFGIVVLSTQYKVLLPLQQVRGNHMKISMALSKLKWYLEDMSADVRRGGTGDLDLIGIGIQEAVCLYYKQIQSLASGCSTQLELTMFTAQSQKSVLSSVKNAASQLDFQHIRKIQTVFLRSRQDLVRTSPVSACVDKINDSPSWQDDLEPSGFLETMLLDPTTSSIHSFFMSWLHVSDTDAEFLRINFHSGFFVRCDAQERIVSPLCLDSHGTLDLSTFLLETRMASSSIPREMRRRIGGEEEEEEEEEDAFDGVHELEVVALVDLDTICDSLLFGNPLILKATSCWKLDWDELESNQQNFLSLCQQLNDKHKAMLLKLNPSSQRRGKDVPNGKKKFSKPRMVPGKSSSSSSSSSSFRPHYVIMPSSSHSLLLKSISSWELLIPLDVQSLGNCQEGNQRAVELELAAVELLPMFDPFSVSSNLFSSLKSLTCKSPDNDSDDNIDVDDLPPAPKMRPSADVSKLKNARVPGPAKKTFAPVVTPANKTPAKRRLCDPTAFGVNFPDEF